MRHIVVLGAGVVGMTTAYALAKLGLKVSVIDGASEPATAGASFGNGAQLSYFYTDAMASPSLATKLPKYLLGLDPAFRVKFSPNPAFLSWGLRFLANSSQKAFERNTVEILKLALESRVGITELSKKIEFDYSKTGKITLFPTVASLVKAQRLTDIKNQLGAKQDILTRQQALDREPALANYGHEFAGAVWSPLDEAGDSNLFSKNLRKLLEDEYGVHFILNTRVERLRTRMGQLVAVETDSGDIECNEAVLALGAWTAGIAKTAGVVLPIWPVQGYSFTVPALVDAPTISITDTSRKTVFCRIGDRLRVAGLADIGSAVAVFDKDRFSTLLETAKGILPKAGEYRGEVNAWTGMRPVTPDSRPIVGHSKIKGLYLNCGHGSLGWTLSIATGMKVADLIATL